MQGQFKYKSNIGQFNPGVDTLKIAIQLRSNNSTFSEILSFKFHKSWYNYEYFVELRNIRNPMIKLTEQEEEAMQLIWKNKGGFVKDILALLPEPRVPYTTLASTLKNLEKKQYLKSEKLGNSCRYEPIVHEDEYKKVFMGNFVSDYFKNSYKDLVSFFAKEEKISPKELKEILEMIQKSKS